MPSPCRPFIFYLVLLQSVKLQESWVCPLAFLWGRVCITMWTVRCVCKPWGGLQGFFELCIPQILFWKCKGIQSFKGTHWWVAVLPYDVKLSWRTRVVFQHWRNHRLNTGAGRRNSCVPWLSKHQPIPVEILQWNQLPGSWDWDLGEGTCGFQELLKSAGVCVLLHKFSGAMEMHIC